MITAKKSLTKIKKSTSSSNITGKKKQLKQGKKTRGQKTERGDNDERVHKITEPYMTPIHENSNQTFKTFQRSNDIDDDKKENSDIDPYQELFQRCQRNAEAFQKHILMYKQRLKWSEKKVLKEKKVDKAKNTTFSPIKSTQKQIYEIKSAKKRHKTSKSVELLKYGDNLANRLKSESQEKVIRSKRQSSHIESRHQRISSSNMSGKKSINGDTAKNAKKGRQQQETLKKDLSRPRSKSSRSALPPAKKLSSKLQLNRENKCVSQLGKRLNHNESQDKKKYHHNKTPSKQRNIRTEEAFSSSSNNSLITIQDFDELRKEEKILNLISEIEEQVKDKNIQRKLHKLSKITSKYIKTNQNNIPLQRTDRQTNTPTKSQFRLYQLNEINDKIEQDDSFSKQLLYSKRDRQEKIPKNRQIPESHKVQYFPDDIQCIPVQTKFHASTIDELQYRSPKTSFEQIEKILNQRSIMSNTKYKNKLKVAYKLYQNNLYSPRTFQNKLQFIDFAQDKQLNQHLQLSNRIRGLAKQIKEDRQEIEELETIFKEERWEDADEMIKMKEEEQHMKKALKQFIKVSPRPEKMLNLPTSPENKKDDEPKNLKINQIFQQFYKLSPDMLNSEQEQQSNIADQKTAYQDEILYGRNRNINDQEQNENLDFSQISVIRSYCIKIFRHIIQSPLILKQFVTNLLSPVQYNMRDLLFVYHLDLNESMINPNSHPTYHYWKRTLPDRQIISSNSIQQIIVSLCQSCEDVSNLSLIHQRMIFDALNESLRYQLCTCSPLLFPADSSTFKHLKYSVLLQSYFSGCYEAEQEIQNIYIRSVQRLIGWAKFYCGTLTQTFVQETKRTKEGIQPDETDQSPQTRRQVRMALLLHGSLAEIDEQVKDISTAQIEVKLRLQRRVQDLLMLQIVNELFTLKNGTF